jgi:alpha-glucoside transport system permease protein
MTSTGTVARPAAPTKAPPRAVAAGGRGRGGWLVKGSLVLVCFMWVVPTLGLFVTSFRTRDAVNSSGWWTTLLTPFSNWTLENYVTVVSREGFGNAFLNTFAVVLPATIIPVMIAAFAAYAFTFMGFPGREVLFIVIVGLLVVPTQVALVPLLQLYGSLGITGTFAAVWLAHIGFGMPLAIYLLRNYMATLPRSIIESAKIDGASHFTTFWRLVVPMSVPALASFAIFQFLWVWNDLLIALLFIGPGDNAVIQVQLASLLGQQGQGWQLLTAGAFISIAIPLLVFITLQRYFIRGLTAGAVKG